MKSESNSEGVPVKSAVTSLLPPRHSIHNNKRSALLQKAKQRHSQSGYFQNPSSALNQHTIGKLSRTMAYVREHHHNSLLGDPNLEAERKLSFGTPGRHNKSVASLGLPRLKYNLLYRRPHSKDYSGDLNLSELNVSQNSAASCDYKGDVMEEFTTEEPHLNNFKIVKTLTPLLMSEKYLQRLSSGGRGTSSSFLASALSISKANLESDFKIYAGTNSQRSSKAYLARNESALVILQEMDTLHNTMDKYKSKSFHKPWLLEVSGMEHQFLKEASEGFIFVPDEDSDFPLKDVGESVIMKGRINNNSIVEVREDEIDDDDQDFTTAARQLEVQFHHITNQEFPEKRHDQIYSMKKREFLTPLEEEESHSPYTNEREGAASVATKDSNLHLRRSKMTETEGPEGQFFSLDLNDNRAKTQQTQPRSGSSISAAAEAARNNQNSESDLNEPSPAQRERTQSVDHREDNGPLSNIITSVPQQMEESKEEDSDEIEDDPLILTHEEKVCREHLIHTFHAVMFSRQLQPVSPTILRSKRLKLPILPDPKMKTIVFDLDQTLIHCLQSAVGNPYLLKQVDAVLDVKFPNGEIAQAPINVRPYAIECLQRVSQKNEVIVFTASHQCYADVILDYLDPEHNLIHHRLYREHCVVTPEGIHIKNLEVLGNRDLKNVVIIDNAVYSFGYQLDNGIPMIPFYDNRSDKELVLLMQYLESLENVEDVREHNRKAFSLYNFNQDKLKEQLSDGNDRAKSPDQIVYEEEEEVKEANRAATGDSAPRRSERRQGRASSVAGTGALPLDDSSILKYEEESREESGFLSFTVDDLNEKSSSRAQGITVMNENLQMPKVGMMEQLRRSAIQQQ